MRRSSRLVQALIVAALLLAGCGEIARGGAPKPTSMPRTAQPPRSTATAAPTVTFRIEGVIEQIDDDDWLIDGQRVRVGSDVTVRGTPAVGAWAEVTGVSLSGGRRSVREVIVVADTLRVVGPFERAEGPVWFIGGTPVVLSDSRLAGRTPAVGLLVTALVRPESGGRLLALRVALPDDLVLVGRVTSLSSAALALDDRPIELVTDSLLAPGVALGALVRVTVRVDGARLVAITIELLPGATVVEGIVEAIEGRALVIGGRRLSLDWRTLVIGVRLAVGERLRLIIVDDGGVIVVLSISRAVVVVRMPAVIVQPPQPPPPPPPPPRPAPPPARSDDDDDDDDD